MKDGRHQQLRQLGGSIDQELGRVVDFLGAVVPARAREQVVSGPNSDLSNVIPFALRPRPGADRQAPVLNVAEADRPAPHCPLNKRGQIALFVLASLAVHASVFAAFVREPAPQASIGLVTISAELVLGAETEAGHEQKASEANMTSAASPTRPEPQAERAETAREAEEATKAEPEAKPEAASAMQQVATPQPEPELAAAPKPPEKPIKQVKAEEEAKPAPKPAQKTERSREKGKQERTRSTPASVASIESNSVGRGRSDADTNYRGVVAAHLARYKQFPSDARGRGDHGTATVTFTIDGSGRVTSARLAHGSGYASLDQETQAMVHRASPFPAPPSGRSMTFTVPVSFSLR